MSIHQMKKAKQRPLAPCKKDMWKISSASHQYSLCDMHADKVKISLGLPPQSLAYRWRTYNIDIYKMHWLKLSLVSSAALTQLPIRYVTNLVCLVKHRASSILQKIYSTCRWSHPFLWSDIPSINFPVEDMFCFSALQRTTTRCLELCLLS